MRLLYVDFTILELYAGFRYTPVRAGEGSSFGLGVIVVEDGFAAADARVRAAARLPAAARCRQRLPLRPDQATTPT